jgi:hypothetical protein
MPNGVGKELNRTIRTAIDPAEVGVGLFPFVAYTVRVDSEKGQSLTKFVATIEIAQADINANNGIQVILVENTLVTPTLFPTFEFILRNALMYYIDVFPQRFYTLKDTFDSPFQMKAGVNYTMFVFFSVTLTASAILDLTVFGFQNASLEASQFYASPR